MPPVKDENMVGVFQLLQERAGIDPERLGVSSIVHAVEKRMAAKELESPEEYATRLQSDRAEFQELLDEVLVDETWMFRDRLAFRSFADYLRGLSHDRREPIRILSVACSTGEETYSLAMTLREVGFDPAQFRLMGIELSQRALETARSGILGERSFREPDAAINGMRDRWCEFRDSAWRIGEGLRQGVEFAWGNLLDRDFLAPESPFHVLFCRNVLIYFHAEARRTAVQNLQRLLHPDGILYTAPAEARIFSDAGFQARDGDCPFAFRSPQKSSATSPSSASRPKQQWPSFFEKTEPQQAVFKSIDNFATSDLPRPVPFDVRTGETSSDASLKDRLEHNILEAARQAADNGRLEEAEKLCGEILTREPTNIEALYLHGVVLQARGMLNEAQRSLEKALYLDPKHYQALVHMILVSEQRGDANATANYRRRAGQAAPGKES